MNLCDSCKYAQWEYECGECGESVSYVNDCFLDEEECISNIENYNDNYEEVHKCRFYMENKQ